MTDERIVEQEFVTEAFCDLFQDFLATSGNFFANAVSRHYGYLLLHLVCEFKVFYLVTKAQQIIDIVITIYQARLFVWIDFK